MEKHVKNCRRDRRFFAVAAVVSGVFMYLYTFDLPFLERISATAFMVAFCAVLASICHRGIIRMKADLTGGMLEVIEGRITWKPRWSGTYSAGVGDITVFIPSSELARMAVGDKVHLERASASRVVLKVSHVSTADSRGGPK